MEKAKSTKTNQRKITTASSTDTKMRMADPYATWERAQKEDVRPKASQRRKVNSMEHEQLRVDGSLKQRRSFGFNRTVLHNVTAQVEPQNQSQGPRMGARI